MPPSLVPSQHNIKFDPSDTESWTSSTPSPVDFDTPKTSLTAEFINSFEDLGHMSSSSASDSHNESHPEIPAGTYRLKNAENPSYCLDLAGYDAESIIAWELLRGTNQMWQILPLGPGYSIKAVFPAKYVTLKDGIIAGGQMRGSAYPVSWIIERALGNTSDWRIRWPESDFIIDAPEGGQGHTIQLFRAPVGGDSPRTSHWVLMRTFDDEPNTFEVKSDPNVTKNVSNTVVNTEGLKEGGNGEISITTTTTTTSTSVTTIKKFRDLY
ncbi:hypothetical protein BJ165DRAFT_1517578 [Panaeolus papilionaceus]|nr:hypothetical protein BJ165DRAFT_1517578 [Panaeolus papilionaceus]